jgi:aldose 1-epimerase
MTLTGEQYEISAGAYRAVITEQGAALRELGLGDRPLILSHGADEVAPAAFGQLLAPWPNRIAGGRYSYDGDDQQLAISEPATGNAIHGLVRWEPWTLAAREDHSVRLEFRLLGQKGYPFRLDLTADYSLDADHGLTVTISARNTGSRTAPYGHGSHPYLTVGETIDRCRVTVPADCYQPVDDRSIPDGPPLNVEGTPYDLRSGRVLGDLRLDYAFTALRRGADGKARVRLESGDGSRATVLWADFTHPWLEIYSADAAPDDLHRLGLAAEPMTCPPDAFNSGTDLVELKPGDIHSGSWGIHADDRE